MAQLNIISTDIAIAEKLQIVSDMRVNMKSLEDPANEKMRTLETV